MVAPLGLLGLNLAAGLVGSVVDGLGGAAPTAAPAKTPDALRKTANEFETVFLEGTLDRITETLGDEGPLGNGGTGGSVYRSMLVKEYAGEIVRSGGTGLSNAVYRQLLQLQEAAAAGQGGAADVR